MKKRYFIIPIICITVLVAIIVSVALIMNSRFLKRVSYDHIAANSYNGVEIIGEDGKFYLYKDQKKVSRGYAHLMSVNDLYGSTVLNELTERNRSVVLFDYYIATSAEDTAACMLVTSTGEEYVISGEGYTLDTSASRLPYLVYVNNKNGLLGVVSLHRLDSDLSYKSGNELTLRSFSDISVKKANTDDILGTYLVTEDVPDSDGLVKSSYFRNDGMKLTTGNDIETITLTRKNQSEEYLYFYNRGDRQIISSAGELIATDVEELHSPNFDWRYAECTNSSTNTKYITVFSPDKVFTLTSESYDLSTLWTTYDRAIVLKAKDSSDFDIINVTSAKTTRYKNIEWVNGMVRADNGDGQYYYLDGDGATLIKTAIADMTLNQSLSSDTCYVLYQPSSPAKLYFTRAGAEAYTYEFNLNETIARLDNAFVYDTYTIARLDGAELEYALLAPFSAIKQSDYYDSIECSIDNTIAWIKAVSVERSELDILDPLTLKTVTGFLSSPEDFDDYSLGSVYDCTLYTDARDDDTEVNITIVTLTKDGTDLLKNGVRYFALYRSAYYWSVDSFYTATLQIKELDSDLLIDEPIVDIERDNCLITYSASGSKVYSFDSNLELVNSAAIPYPIYDIIEDEVTEESYFVVCAAYEDNAMYGVYNFKGECLLTPYYSSVDAAADGRFIVMLRGAYGVVSAKANTEAKTVIDFKNTFTMHLCDGAFAAYENLDSINIYVGKRVILSGNATDLNTINYYTVAEDGSLSVDYGLIIYIDGKSYIHR